MRIRVSYGREPVRIVGVEQSVEAVARSVELQITDKGWTLTRK
jgi:hypothetical protein